MNNNENGQSAAKQIVDMQPIPGFNDYLISKNGDVYSTKTNKFLNPSRTKDGYLKVSLRGNGKAYYFRVHKLVAMTYLDNPGNLSEVNHKDFDRTNNSLDNLEWISHDDNIEYSKNNNRFKGDKPLRKAYVFTNVFNNKSFTILGIKNVAKHFNIKQDSLKAIRNHANTGDYIKSGVLKNLKVDIYDLKVQRLESNLVDSSESKCGTPDKGEDIV